jgi:hypothetical protein
MAEQIHTARDILTYLFSECEKWEEDFDGDQDADGRMRVCSFHTIELKGSLLEELVDMAGIKRGWTESALEALARANHEDDSGLPPPPKEQDEEIIF